MDRKIAIGGGDADERVTVKLAHPANESDVRAGISNTSQGTTFVAAILVGMSSIGYLAGFEALPALVCGSIFDVWIKVWNDLWDESEELTYIEAELEVIVRLVDRFEGFAGVWLEDGSGDEIDIDDLAHPNAADGGMDCIIVIDPDAYTEAGYQRTCSRVLNIVSDGDY